MDVYKKISQMIKDNSIVIMQNDLLEVFSDFEVNNIPLIIKQMLKDLTNIEDNFDSKSEDELKNIFTLANGDFKKVIQVLMDIILEIGQDNRLEEIMKLKELNNKLISFKQSLTIGINLQQTLSEYGLDSDKLIKLKDGDESVLQEIQKHIIKDIEKEIKPKRQYNRKKK
jgi:hypothetical protein